MSMLQGYGSWEFHKRAIYEKVTEKERLKVGLRQYVPPGGESLEMVGD